MTPFYNGHFIEGRINESSESVWDAVNSWLASVWVFLVQLIRLKLRHVLLELRGHVTDGKTQFLLSVSHHSFVSCRAIQLI